MALFRSRQPSPAASDVSFDGMAGRDNVEWGSDDFLTNIACQNVDAALKCTQMIFEAMPGDPHAPISSTFLEDRWRWIHSVARRASQDGRSAESARIGLMTEIWNRRILKQQPSLQFGRLVKSPVDLELGIYEAALTSLLQMDSTAPLVTGPGGWSVSEATEQISATVRLLESDGCAVPERLRGLASGDPVIVDSLQGRGSPGAEGGPDDHAVLEQAIADMQSGDDARGLFAAAAIALGMGERQQAFEMLERAGRLGHIEAMCEAGTLAEQMGNPTARRCWAEAAANAGSPLGMYNLAVDFADQGDRTSAAHWFQQAAERGKPDGYAALVELSEQGSDEASARHWAALGAEAGHPHCLQRHGYFLYSAGLRSAGLATTERAAEQGHDHAMVVAGIMHHECGDMTRARYWLLKAREKGNPRAAEMLSKLALA